MYPQFSTLSHALYLVYESATLQAIMNEAYTAETESAIFPLSDRIFRIKVLSVPGGNYRHLLDGATVDKMNTAEQI